MLFPGTKENPILEISVVAGIIGILTAIAVPSFIQVRLSALRGACVINMKQIQGACAIYAIDNASAADAACGKDELVPDYLRAWPACLKIAYPCMMVDDTPICPNAARYPDHML